MAMASPQIPGDLSPTNTPQSQADERRAQALEDFRILLVECREKEVKLKDLRMGIREFERQYTQSEHDIQALQSVGQIIGEVLKELDGIFYPWYLTHLFRRPIYCKDYQWPSLYCGLPSWNGPDTIATRHSCCP